MKSNFAKAALCSAFVFSTLQASAQTAKERIRIFSLRDRPFLALQLIQNHDSVEQRLYKFNANEFAYPVKLAENAVIQGFSETTFLLSKEFSFVVPSGASLAKGPRLVHTIDRAKPAAITPVSKIELTAFVATESEVNLIRPLPEFVGSAPVRYQTLKSENNIRVILQTSMNGDDVKTQVFAVRPDSSVEAQIVKSTVVGFSNTIYFFANGETLDVPTNPAFKATLTEPGNASSQAAGAQLSRLGISF